MTTLRGPSPVLATRISVPAYLAVSCFFLVGMRQNLTVPMTLGLSIGQFMVFALSILWALMRLRGDSPPVRNHALMVVVLGYLVAVLLSYGAATGRGLPSVVIPYSDRYVLTTLAYAVMAFAIVAMVKTTDGLLLVIKGLLLGGSLSAAFAIIEFRFGIDLASSFRLPGLKSSDFLLVKDLMREGVVRSQGSAGHPLELAAVLTTLTPLGVGVVAAAHARGERMWPWMICTLTLAAGGLATVSRSVLLGMFAATAVMAWRWPVGRVAATLIGVVTAGAMAWLVQLKALSAITSTIGLANADQDPSFASRAFGSHYVASHYPLHFWLGQGIGTYPLGPDQPLLDNEYLSKLMEGGVLGLLAYAVLLVVALTLALYAAKSTIVANAEIAGGIAGSITVLIVVAAVLDIDGFIQCRSLAWVIIALSAVAFGLCRQGEGTADGSSTQLTGSLSPSVQDETSPVSIQLGPGPWCTTSSGDSPRG